jgi:PAS domain S-box-containing protein
VGLAMLLITAIVAAAQLNVMTAFSSITDEMTRTAGKMRGVDSIQMTISGMSGNLHRFVAANDRAHRESYEAALATIRGTLDELENLNLDVREQRLAAGLRADLVPLEEKAQRIFALRDPLRRDRVVAHNLVTELDGLLGRVNRDIAQHLKEEQAIQISRLAEYVGFQRSRILILFIAILLLTAGFLAGFGVYIHRKVAMPLNDLWKGASEISKGNLDYQMQLQGSSDVALLAARFNDMARKLRSSYAELEKKLLERTNELAAIDAVALTLSQAGNLKDMLSRSLAMIIESLSGLEPRGGVFLCEPDGETLRLVAHEGLPPGFVEQEGTIRMGECLCGMAAQSGEILYSEKGCIDARHTRGHDAHDHAHVVIPIKSRGIVLGVIFLYPQKEFDLKPSDIQMFDTIGAQLGLAVENLQFYTEVKESSDKFWGLFENSRDILFTVDTSGTLTAANKAAEDFTGYSKSELIGKNVLEFLTPDGAEAAKRLLDGEGVPGDKLIEFEVVNRDGRRAFIELSARRLVRQRAHAGYQVSARDVTEQKLIRKKLVQAERLGAIGEIVITVRHEINNPLTTVIGNLELLIERYGDRDKGLTARLETVLGNALRIAEIVKQLQAIKRDKVVEYVRGVTMTDLKQK